MEINTLIDISFSGILNYDPCVWKWFDNHYFSGCCRWKYKALPASKICPVCKKEIEIEPRSKVRKELEDLIL